MDDFKNLIDNLVRDGYTINTGSLSFSKQLNGSIVTVKVDKAPNDIYCEPENPEDLDKKYRRIKEYYHDKNGDLQIRYVHWFDQRYLYCIASYDLKEFILENGYLGEQSKIQNRSLLCTNPWSSKWREYAINSINKDGVIFEIDIYSFMNDYKDARFTLYDDAGEVTTSDNIPPKYITPISWADPNLVNQDEKKEESKTPKSNAIFAKGYLLRPKHTLKKILKEGLFFGYSNIMLKTHKPMRVAKNSVILSIDLAKYVEECGATVESKSKDSPVIHLYLNYDNYDIAYRIPAEYITVEEPEPKYQSIRTTALSDYFAKHPIGFYVGKAYNGLNMEDNSIDSPEEGRYIELSLSIPYVRTGATIYSVDLEAFVNNNPEADITVINPHDKKDATVLVREDIPAEYVKPGVEYPKYSDDYLNTEPGKAIMKDLEKGQK